MKLSYRGIAYESQNPVIETVETEQMGVFLGKSFKMKTFNVTQRHSDPTPLKYRGVDYNRD